MIRWLPSVSGRTQSILLCASLALLLLSGCTGDTAGVNVQGGDPSLAPPETAPEPEVDEALGSIAGTVTDEDLLPLAGVRVTILETMAYATTDLSGAFTINGVEPGEYRLEFSRLGHNSALRPVEVAAAEVARIQVHLARLDVAPEPYHWSVVYTGHIQLGQWTLQWAQHVVNNSALDQALCDPCSFILFLQPNASAAMTEVDFTPSVSLPVVNQAVGVGVTRIREDPTPSYIHSDTYGPRDQLRWSEESIDVVNEMEAVRVQLHGPNPGTYGPGFAFDQRVDIWHTFFHHAEMPDAYTALPPQ